MTVVGATRPPAPMTVALGRGLPVERVTIVGPVSSVVVRFAFVAPPGRNSATLPSTWMWSPTETVGAVLVKTKIPFGRGWIGVDGRVGLLDPEAIGGIGRHDSARGNRCADQRREVRGALDRVDAGGATVVVDDGAGALAVADGRPGDVRDVHEEGLVGLDGGVTVDRDIERVGGIAGRNRLACQALRHVVVVGRRRRVVIGGDVERHAAGGRRRREADREAERRRSGVALVRRNVVDREFGSHRPTLSGQREVIDSEAVIRAGNKVGVDPAQPERGARGNRQPSHAWMRPTSGLARRCRSTRRRRPRSQRDWRNRAGRTQSRCPL